MNSLSRFSTSIGRLRILNDIEGLTLLLLVAIAVPLKYLAGHPEFVKILGPIHGVAFILYALQLAYCSIAGRWTFFEIFKLALSAFIPFGFLACRGLLARKESGGQTASL